MTTCGTAGRELGNHEPAAMAAQSIGCLPHEQCDLPPCEVWPGVRRAGPPKARARR
jgi:hypothetical protein